MQGTSPLKWKASQRNGSPCLISSCQDYIIINKGQKGGNKYQCWKRDYADIVKDCYCQLIEIGTADECKERVK